MTYRYYRFNKIIIWFWAFYTLMEAAWLIHRMSDATLGWFFWHLFWFTWGSVFFLKTKRVIDQWRNHNFIALAPAGLTYVGDWNGMPFYTHPAVPKDSILFFNKDDLVLRKDATTKDLRNHIKPRKKQKRGKNGRFA